MNSLSWMIYLAEVSGRGQDLSGFLALMVGLPGMFAVGFAWAELGRLGATLVTFAWALLLILFIGAAVLLPSPATIYMVAASEAGETVVTSPEAIEMMGDLKAIIKKRLAEELGK